MEVAILFNDLSNIIWVPTKAEDLNLNVFNMITEINESKILTKHISRKCEYKLNTRKCNSNQMWNNDKCRYVCKNPIEHHVWKKSYIWNPPTCTCENGRHARSIIDNSVSTCDEIMEETKFVPTKSTSTKTVPIDFNKNKVAC